MPEWKTVPDAPGYEASADGQVRSVKTLRVLKPYTNKTGVKTLSLRVHGRSVSMSIHRCVARAFLTNPTNFPVVLHADGDAGNNRVENLRWGNMKMLYEQTRPTRKKRERPSRKAFAIQQLDYDGRFLREFVNSKEAVKWLLARSVPQTTSAICVRVSIQKAARQGLRMYGFQWKYVTAEEDAVVIAGEVWKPVRAVFGDDIARCQVSNMGRFKSASGFVLKGSSRPGRSPLVQACGKSYTLTRLIAFTFLQETNLKKVVIQLDGNPHNTRLANLKLITPSELGMRRWRQERHVHGKPLVNKAATNCEPVEKKNKSPRKKRD